MQVSGDYINAGGPSGLSLLSSGALFPMVFIYNRHRAKVAPRRHPFFGPAPCHRPFFQYFVTLRKSVFMHPELKQKLHLLIDNCEDPYLLEEAKAVLESDQSGKDWWNELSEEDKTEFLESEEEHEDGHSKVHSRLMHQFGEWKKKINPAR
jgi:hypothetical protein